MIFDYLKPYKDLGLIPPIDQVPINRPAIKLSEREEIFACAKTARLLNELGDDIEITHEDEARAQDAFKTHRKLTKHEKKLPGMMLKLEALLTAYDHQIIKDAEQVRNYVKHKLLEETDNEDPKIRLKALELLGKVTDVGIFTERHEITVKHQSTEELEDLLLSKLERVIEGEVVEEVPAKLDTKSKSYKLAETVSVEDLL
jgi:hypothetical protein